MPAERNSPSVTADLADWARTIAILGTTSPELISPRNPDREALRARAEEAKAYLLLLIERDEARQ